MVATRVHRAPGANPALITENYRPGEFLVSMYHESYCHENVLVDGGLAGVAHNSVIVDGADAFVGVVYEGVPAGTTALRALLTRGPAEVSVARLVFPFVTDAVDGVDAGADTTAENAAATAALKTALIAEMTAKLIIVRD